MSPLLERAAAPNQASHRTHLDPRCQSGIRHLSCRLPEDSVNPRTFSPPWTVVSRGTAARRGGLTLHGGRGCGIRPSSPAMLQLDLRLLRCPATLQLALQLLRSGHEARARKRKRKSSGELEEPSTTPLHFAKWELQKKSFFMQSPTKLTSCDYHRDLDMVMVGFSNGVFGLYHMSDFVFLHLLSISRENTTAIFNSLGNWLVFGCAKLGQLLVWEWRSGSYILKHQGHYFGVNSIAYSPDSQLIATGADNNKVKVWTDSSGFCFITFSEHTNAVTAVHFMANNHSLLSASLGGTIRAWDLFHYRNFKTFMTPSPRQFVSLTADQSGEVTCAGTLDSFEIYVWSMKTCRLLDVLSRHQGPVHGLMVSPINVNPLQRSLCRRGPKCPKRIQCTLS